MGHTILCVPNILCWILRAQFAWKEYSSRCNNRWSFFVYIQVRDHISCYHNFDMLPLKSSWSVEQIQEQHGRRYFISVKDILILKERGDESPSFALVQEHVRQFVSQIRNALTRLWNEWRFYLRIKTFEMNYTNSFEPLINSQLKEV